MSGPNFDPANPGQPLNLDPDAEREFSDFLPRSFLCQRSEICCCGTWLCYAWQSPGEIRGYLH